MKIALVNLAQFNKYQGADSFKDDISFLKENNIDFVDYCSKYSDSKNLFAGFNKALDNPDIDLIWFVCGGYKIIKFIDRIDWQKVRKSNKVYAGFSDFTHFSFKAVQNKQVCYYGLTLKRVKEYHPRVADRKYILDFLRSGSIAKYNHVNLYKKVASLDKEKIIGGHLFVSSFMLGEIKINLANRFLLLEHHNIPGESYDDLEYFIDQLKFKLKDNLPKGFILGHTALFDKNGNKINPNIINKKIVSWLKEYGRPIVYINHFEQIIKLS